VGCASTVWPTDSNRLLGNCIRPRDPGLVDALDYGDSCHGSPRDLRSGFFERKSIEVHMNQIESVDVDQTLLGRLFNYGDVTIHGTGTTYEPLRAADRPIALRNEIIAR
jgi:Bacterial PH domain